jgi:hypothetical protein
MICARVMMAMTMGAIMIGVMAIKKTFGEFS